MIQIFVQKNSGNEKFPEFMSVFGIFKNDLLIVEEFELVYIHQRTGGAVGAAAGGARYEIVAVLG